MFDNEDFFLQSLPDGNRNKVAELNKATRKLIDERISGDMFTQSVPQKSKFQYLDDSIKRSKTNKSVKFTNYISNAKTEYIKMCLQKLNEDLNVILESEGVLKPITVNTRFKNCLSLYLEEVEEQDSFMQSDIRDSAGGQVGVRIYFRLDLDEESMPVYVIVLIDPHHLVFPTDYRGKSKSKVVDEKYKANAGQGHCMSRYLE